VGEKLRAKKEGAMILYFDRLCGQDCVADFKNKNRVRLNRQNPKIEIPEHPSAKQRMTTWQVFVNRTTE